MFVLDHILILLSSNLSEINFLLSKVNGQHSSPISELGAVFHIPHLLWWTPNCDTEYSDTGFLFRNDGLTPPLGVLPADAPQWSPLEPISGESPVSLSGAACI